MNSIRSHLILILIVLIILLQLVACSPAQKNNDKLQIVTTIYPYEILIREIVGDKGTVVSFIPPNASPHTYSPTPADIKLMENADLIISNGMDLEIHLNKFLGNLKERHISADIFVRDLISHNNNVEEKKHNHETGHSHQHSFNPHFWLDPILLVNIIQGVTEKIIEIDPDNALYYVEKMRELQNNLATLDTTIMSERKELGVLNLIHFHEAFYYFNRRYGINSVGVVVKSPGREPTPGELMELGQLIKEYRVSVIFIEPQLDPKGAQVIADEYQLTIEILDPLGYYLKAEDISELITLNWVKMRPHFKKL